MTEDDFRKLPKGTVLYSADSYFAAASNQAEDTIVVVKWTVIGAHEKNFCIESQHGRRERGRIYNYPTLIRSLKLTADEAVEHLIKCARLEVERAEERVRAKREMLATLTRLRDAGAVNILNSRRK